jgi:hypothetical protein
MIQPLGESPERLLKQSDGSFAMRSAPAGHVSFVVKPGRPVALKMDPSPVGVPLSGDRVGPGDPQTFHRQLR